MSSTLLHTALQNLHVSQRKESLLRPSSEPGMRRPPVVIVEDDELVHVGGMTRPGTPRGERVEKTRVKDPLRTLPTHLAVRVFLQLDIKSLARCDRVCKRWHKSSTLNYVWFLQNRALILPTTLSIPTRLRQLPSTFPLPILSSTSSIPSSPPTPSSNPPELFFDPYDKLPRLSRLPLPPIPTSQTPQWSKTESKKSWKTQFRMTFQRPDNDDSLKVDFSFSRNSSGASSPGYHGHGYSGLGSGNKERWVEENEEMSNTARKVLARERYKEMRGRKSKEKRKMGGELGIRDKGGLGDVSRFEAPW
ncbi:hypothetical protein TREMEDRAFT_69593 [Tremella mesenterica DSM 1558]|uniref:uncharacterized protein n=1 Tax=Tremella mesenterica (strain ATCC 24925 / CBS 8224 / DSM 1558 / NBRC 9311 / NRRL Y-6157 / RJB 2259-6 / UBC 559-6) TaxID=578456 RepID=UPI0003F493DC|nr:uncharacterized protein TREMEDRAFT_69593 [Tremella mesenterica DSM 1558]EIW68144.1 hypothetical protein TREMEDRAFT_69593 [Tremella mesenterica DSM 1558]